MCGICFYLNGILIQNNEILFDPFELYIDNPYIKEKEGLKEKYLNQTSN
jgi:hypothetical protein